MPYLNCVERSDQNDLVKILKKLYEDLKIGKMDTLKDFRVPWTRIDMMKLAPTCCRRYFDAVWWGILVRMG